MNVKRAKWTIFFFLVALLIVAVVILRVLPSMGVRKQILAIKTAGLPVSPLELDVWYKSVPAAENRAFLILDAAKERVDPPKSLDFSSLKADEEIPPSLEETIRQHLARSQKALAKLHEAGGLPASRYPIDLSNGASTLLPHLAPIKGLVQLLRMDAIYQSRAGNLEGAVRSINAAFSVASSLRNEPLFISELVRIACIAITLNTLERVLTEHPLTENNLVAWSEKVAEAEADGLEGLSRGMIGERADGVSAFDLSFSELERLGESGPGQNSADTTSQEWLRGIGFQAYRVSGLRERDMSLYLEMMDGFINAPKTGFPEALRQTQQIEDEMQTRFSKGFGRLAILSRMLLPALSRGTVKEADASARLRCAQVALAVERFRLGHDGALPGTLEELSPKYLHKLPADPFDGSALVYEKMASKGYRVVSPGASAQRKKETKRADDVAISIFR